MLNERGVRDGKASTVRGQAVSIKASYGIADGDRGETLLRTGTRTDPLSHGALLPYSGYCPWGGAVSDGAESSPADICLNEPGSSDSRVEQF